jgi:hypothetical protein
MKLMINESRKCFCRSEFTDIGIISVEEVFDDKVVIRGHRQTPGGISSSSILLSDKAIQKLFEIFAEYLTEKDDEKE